MSDSLFEVVVKATGLSPRIAPFVVRRVCASVGFPAVNMNKAQLLSSLEAMATALRIYKSPAEADEAVERLKKLAASHN